MDEPTTRAPEPVPVLDSGLDSGLDPELVSRLWRPVDHPGVVDPGLPRAILARHQRMVAGVPLAELVARHTGSVPDLAGTAVPIVYATAGSAVPAPAPAQAAQTTQVSQGAPVPTAESPAVPVALAVPATHEDAAPTGPPPIAGPATPGPAAPGALSPERPGSTAPDGEAPAAVRPEPTPSRADPGPPLRLAAPATGPAATSDAAPAPARRLRAVGSSPSGSSPSGSPGPRPPQPGTPPDAQRVVAPPGVPAGPGDMPRSVTTTGGGRPIVAARLPMPWPDGERLARPLPPAAPGHARSGYPETGYSSPGYPRTDYPQPGYPQPGYSGHGGTGHVAAVTAQRPRSGPETPLLLADLTGAPGRAARGGPGPTGQPDPMVRRPPLPGPSAVPGPSALPGPSAVPGHGAASGPVGTVPGPAADAPRGTTRAAPVRGQPPAPIDIEQIVDTVHRRFVRRLAVEAERRAVRR